MEATITKIRENGVSFWKLEVGFSYRRFFPIETKKTIILKHAEDNGADHIRFLRQL